MGKIFRIIIAVMITFLDLVSGDCGVSVEKFIKPKIVMDNMLH